VPDEQCDLLFTCLHAPETIAHLLFGLLELDDLVSLGSASKAFRRLVLNVEAHDIMHRRLGCYVDLSLPALPVMSIPVYERVIFVRPRTLATRDDTDNQEHAFLRLCHLAAQSRDVQRTLADLSTGRSSRTEESLTRVLVPIVRHRMGPHLTTWLAIARTVPVKRTWMAHRDFLNSASVVAEIAVSDLGDGGLSLSTARWCVSWMAPDYWHADDALRFIGAVVSRLPPIIISTLQKRGSHTNRPTHDGDGDDGDNDEILTFLSQLQSWVRHLAHHGGADYFPWATLHQSSTTLRDDIRRGLPETLPARPALLEAADLLVATCDAVMRQVDAGGDPFSAILRKRLEAL
jgi:hypothetical protein